MQALGAGEIEEGFVDRQRLDQRREREHRLAHLAADFDVFRHVRLDHHGVRAAAQRLEHRHRRADAVGARHVAAGRDHAAFAAADDHRFVDQASDRRAFRWWRRRRRNRHARWSAGRARDGAPAAASRRPDSALAVSGASARQSRQKLTASRAPNAAAQRGQRLANVRRIAPGLGGKGRQQALVAGEVFQARRPETRVPVRRRESRPGRCR